MPADEGGAVIVGVDVGTPVGTGDGMLVVGISVGGEVGTLVGDTLHTMRRRNALNKLSVDFKRADLLIEDVYRAASEVSHT